MSDAAEAARYRWLRIGMQRDFNTTNQSIDAAIDKAIAAGKSPPDPKSMRPCPACHDGGIWTSEGPTGKICPTCKGHAVIHLDGSPLNPFTEV